MRFDSLKLRKSLRDIHVQTKNNFIEKGNKIRNVRMTIWIMVISLCLTNSPIAIADCPSADLTDDCFVDFEDFALMVNQWLTTDPCVPDDMVYIPDGSFVMGDHFSPPEGYDHELPLHDVLLDSFFMSKFETTNQQYCDYLNSAYPAQLKVVGGVVYAASDSSNSYPYCDTHSANTSTS